MVCKRLLNFMPIKIPPKVEAGDTGRKPSTPLCTTDIVTSHILFTFNFNWFTRSSADGTGVQQSIGALFVSPPRQMTDSIDFLLYQKAVYQIDPIKQNLLILFILFASEVYAVVYTINYPNNLPETEFFHLLFESVLSNQILWLRVCYLPN